MENHLTPHQNIVCIGSNKQIPKNSKSTHVCGEDTPIFKCGQCGYDAKQSEEIGISSPLVKSFVLPCVTQ